MTDKILFFFGLLGVFNTLIFSCYFFFTKGKPRFFNLFLAILLLCLFIRVGVSCFYFFETVPIGIIQLGLVANLFIGPTALYLLKIGIGSNLKLAKHYIVHISFLSIAILLSWIWYDFQIWDREIRYTIHAILSMYLLIGLIKHRKAFVELLSSGSSKTNSRKATLVYVAVLAVCLGFVISLYTNYILGPLFYSIIFYLSFGYYLTNNRNKKKQYENKRIDPKSFNIVNKRLTALMESERLYQDASLSLELLASKLSVSKHFLSQMLNDNLNKSFYDYINEYRIKEACQLLAENKPYSMEAIGYEVGFRSKSSFFSIFKKLQGKTPSQYKSEL